jgi:uncharacterized protein (TIGR02145 family)
MQTSLRKMLSLATLVVAIPVLILSCSKNSAPVIESMVADPEAVYPGDTVTLKFSASDADKKDGLLIYWSCTSGKLIMATNAPPQGPVQWVAPKQIGEFYISLRINDLTNETIDSVKVDVLDTAGFFADSRDGHNYKWSRIGRQTWMAENLAWLPAVAPSADGSTSSPLYYVYGYEGSTVSEAKASPDFAAFGALYNWPAAKSSCPSGWHLPRDNEWKTLETYLGMTRAEADHEGLRMTGYVGTLLKSTSGWDLGGNGLDFYGFTALPGGDRDITWKFIYRGGNTNFLSSTEKVPEVALSRSFYHYTQGVFRNPFDESYGFSVRCVKD